MKKENHTKMKNKMIQRFQCTKCTEPFWKKIKIYKDEKIKQYKYKKIK